MGRAILPTLKNGTAWAGEIERGDWTRDAGRKFKAKISWMLTFVTYLPLFFTKPQLHPFFFLELSYSRGLLEIPCGEMMGILQHKLERSGDVQERTSQ